MRAGDFSELLAGSKPITVKDPLNNTPFPGNIVPAARITNPVALKLFSSPDFYPLRIAGYRHATSTNGTSFATTGALSFVSSPFATQMPQNQ